MWGKLSVGGVMVGMGKEISEFIRKMYFLGANIVEFRKFQHLHPEFWYIANQWKCIFLSENAIFNLEHAFLIINFGASEFLKYLNSTFEFWNIANWQKDIHLWVQMHFST